MKAVLCKRKGKKTASPQLCFWISVILFAATPLYAIDSLQVLWSTYIGGSEVLYRGDETVCDMVVDHMDNLYIVGITQTSNLPNRTNSHPNAGFGRRCAFATKLSPSGTILWSTYIGGSDVSYGYGITIDPKGNNVFIVGDTDTGEDFPKLLNPAWQTGGGAFVVSLQASNGSIQWSRLLTRNDAWHGQDICMHKNHLFVTGWVGQWGELLNPKNEGSGRGDAFLYQLTVDGGVVNCCFFGGSWGGEAGNDLFIDDQDNIYLTGDIFWEYPGENDYDYDLPKEINEWRGHRRDGFICKFSSAFDVQWSRYIGGKEVDYAHQVIGDNQGNLWIAGKAHSDDMEGELIVPWNGHNEWVNVGDGYLTKIDTKGNLVWTSYAHSDGSDVSRPKLTACGKMVTLRYNNNVFVYDADLGYHQWIINYTSFMGPHCYEGMSFADIFIDQAMNIYICGKTAHTCINFPNRTNEHSGQGDEGFVVKTSPKGHFFHYNDDVPKGWLEYTPEAWSVSDNKYVFTGLARSPTTGRISNYRVEMFNFGFEAQLTKVSGSQTAGFGLNFRYAEDAKNRYRFAINTQGQYYIREEINDVSRNVVDWTATSALKRGMEACNTLRVSARDSVVDFFINGKKINSIKTSTLFSGYCGLYVNDTKDITNIVEFDNVYIGLCTDMQPTNVAENKNRGFPQTYKLYQNYPNPFNPATTIKYTIPKASKVTLRIYNLLGKKIKSLENIVRQRGTFTVQWDGLTEQGVQCPSGLYLCKIRAGDFVDTKKLMLIK